MDEPAPKSIKEQVEASRQASNNGAFVIGGFAAIVIVALTDFLSKIDRHGD